jgi:hypothetical protein
MRKYGLDSIIFVIGGAVLFLDIPHNNSIGFGLLAVAALMAVGHYVYGHRSKYLIPLPAGPNPISPPVETSATDANKIMVTASPAEIAACYATGTRYQGDALFAAFEGKLLTVEGKVIDISSTYSEIRITCEWADQQPRLWLHFDRKLNEIKLSHYLKGHKIKAVGEIYIASSTNVTLTKCQLLG